MNSIKRTMIALGGVAVSVTAVAEEPMSVMAEIVVTAQKRAENLQETPVAITALTAGDIEDRGITGLSDIYVSVPGVTGYEAPSSRGNMGVNIRGVGSGNPNTVSTDPANAIYIDGVYLGKAAGNGVDAMDLERIEVLRGPQGTLYGRNSTGGAINFITRKPGDEFDLTARASAGEEGYKAFSGRIDVPLASAFGVSLSGYARERDAWYDNTRAGGDGFENLDRHGFRFAMRGDLGNNFRVDYAFSMDELDENSQALDVVGFNPSGAGVLGAAGLPGNVAINSTNRIQAIAGFQSFLPFLGPAFATPQVQQLNQWMTDYIAWASAELENGSQRNNSASNDYDQISENEVTGHTLAFTWNLADTAIGDVEFKAITGIREVENLNQGDLDGIDNSVVPGADGLTNGVVHDLVLQTIGGLFFDSVSPAIPGVVEFQVGQALVDAINAHGSAPVFNNFATIDYEQFSQELQMVGNTNSLEYAVGLYYYEDEAEFRNNRSSVFPISSSATSSHDNETESTSVYGQFTWTPGGDSRLSYTLGLRHTGEKKGITYLWRSSANPAGFFGPFFAGQTPAVTYVSDELAETQAPVAGIFDRSFDEDFSNTTGKFTVDLQATEFVNFFATYSKGYRSGGFNGDFFDTANDTADAFDEEIIDNIEVGIKSEFWARARLNITAFTYEYDDLQVSQLLPQPNGTVTSSITNAGSAKRDGIEIELTLMPWDNLFVTLAYTGIDGDYDEFPPVVASPFDGGAVLNTNKLAANGMVPDSQLMFAIDWTIVSGQFGDLHLGVNGVWQDEMTPIALNTGNYDTNGNRLPDTPVAFEQYLSDERTVVNARFAWNRAFGQENLSIALWGRNITDDDYRTFSFNYGEALGLSVAQYGEPQLFGLDVTWEM